MDTEGDGQGDSEREVALKEAHHESLATSAWRSESACGSRQ